MSGPKPETIAAAGSEHAHQVALFCWAAIESANYPELRLMFAIPNGGERNKIVAANLKAEGVKRHVPDIFLPVSRGAFHGLFIELKKPGKHHVDDGQRAFIEELHRLGYGAKVCVGWEEARDMILTYLKWK